MSGIKWLRISAMAAAALFVFHGGARAQTASQSAEPELIQQAQKVQIPVNAIERQAASPARDLTSSDFNLKVDGQPQVFRLSRPWDGSVAVKSGQPQDRPNLLIILPLGDPIDLNQALDKAIADLSQQPELGWNISVLDDAGDQTPYTRDLKTTIAALKAIKNEDAETVNFAGWRSTVALAIAGMRNLPGRRVVMTLGDIFHEVIVDQGQIIYEAFQSNDVATAARNAGATIYAALSSDDVDQLRGMSTYYSLFGVGPWLLVTHDDQVAGWISGPVASTMDAIRRNGMGAYEIDLHLEPKQMDGQLHRISVTTQQTGTILDAPQYYIAPSMARVRQLASISPVLRQALQTPPQAGSSPLELATQLAYFPHSDGKTGTQIATTGFFWNSKTPPPATLQTALELEQARSGLILNSTVGSLDWSSAMPVWNTALDVVPGAFRLRVAAANGKNVSADDTQFTVGPTAEDPVLISSVVLGKSCVFTPQPANATAVDYLRAGNCELRSDPTHQFSPQDIVWTLARITPVGKLAGRPAKDWKAWFELVDSAGSKLAEQPVQWLPATDGSLVATTAFPLGNPKLKLVDGEYAIVFRLKGPGIESNYGEDASFALYGAAVAKH